MLGNIIGKTIISIIIICCFLSHLFIELIIMLSKLTKRLFQSFQTTEQSSFLSLLP